MANGLSAIGHINGAIKPSLSSVRYQLDPAGATGIYQGDLVVLTDAGYIGRAAGGGSASTNLIGVFDSVKYTRANGEVVIQNYWEDEATDPTEVEVRVYDDPGIIYMIEADQVGTALTVASIQSNLDWASGTADTTNKRSGGYADTSSITDGSPGAAQLRVMGSGRLENDWTAVGTAMNIKVKLNEHLLNSQTGQ